VLFWHDGEGERSAAQVIWIPVSLELDPELVVVVAVSRHGSVLMSLRLVLLAEEFRNAARLSRIVLRPVENIHGSAPDGRLVPIPTSKSQTLGWFKSV
jgi:6-phosphogluconate dehydrogenase (decarboxylating)